MATALIHLDPKQKARLARRAKLRGRSFSQEVRNAVDLYLELPIETEDDLKLLAREANEAIDRSIVRLDKTIAYIDRALKAMRKPR
jgi:Ribbon-helix-helix protein, copG family